MTKKSKKFSKKLPPIVYQTPKVDKQGEVQMQKKAWWSKFSIWSLIEILAVILAFVLFLLLISCGSNKPQVVNKSEAEIWNARNFGEKHLLPNKDEKPKYVLKTHITPLELLTYNHKTNKMFVAFVNDDRVYTLSSNNINFVEYRDLLVDNTFKDVFFEVKTHNQEIVSIDEVSVEYQRELRSKVLEKYKVFKEKTQEDQDKKLAIWKVYPMEENRLEMTLSLKDIEDAFKVCEAEFSNKNTSTTVRSVMYDDFIFEKTGVSAYKLIIVPQKSDIKPLVLQHKFNAEKKAWLFFNVYKEVKEVIDEEHNVYHQVSWWVVDPYFFNKPTPLDKVVKEVEWQSDQKVDYFIANQSAFGYNHKDNVVLYKL